MKTIEFTYKDGSKETFENVLHFCFEDMKYVFTSDGYVYTIHVHDIKTYKEI